MGPFLECAKSRWLAPSVSGRLPEIYLSSGSIRLSGVTARNICITGLWVSVMYLYDNLSTRRLQPCSLTCGMHPFGLITFLQFLWEHGIPSLFALMALGLLLSVLFLCRRNQDYWDAPATLPRFPLSHITSFLRQRHDFFARGFRITNQRLFHFRLLHVCQALVALIASAFC